MTERVSIVHPIPPEWSADSRILILGSFPSVKSREIGFFYGHPQNRFWRLLATLFDEPIPETVDEKRALLRAHGIALWDVIGSCSIVGSSDASITDAVPNDISRLLKGSRIERIFVNGGKAAALYDRYILPTVGRAAIRLPSTSPANAAWSLEQLVAAWKIIKEQP